MTDQIPGIDEYAEGLQDLADANLSEVEWEHSRLFVQPPDAEEEA